MEEKRDYLERALAAEGLAWALWFRLSEEVIDPEAVARLVEDELSTDEEKASFTRLREVMAGKI